MSGEPQQPNEQNAGQLSSNLLLAIAAFEAPLRQAMHDAENYLRHTQGLNASVATSTRDSTYRNR